jgi:hypothetical protein
MKHPITGMALAALAALALSTLTACLDGGGAVRGLGTVPALEESGPSIVFDPLRLPQPEVPFPNDFALRVDPTSPTGVRVNVSTETTTRTESELRGHINRLDGFSLFGPISVAFDGPVDLTTVTRDAIWLINVDPSSDELGRIEPLDLGEGSYPTAAPKHNYFPNDPLRESIGFVFPDDNLADLDGDGEEEYVSFYEVATHTLLIRPLLPLRERTRYAVVLTKDMKGWFGEGDEARYGPVRSPFDGVNHASQSDAIRAAIAQLARQGISESDVAFAWQFSTQSVTDVYTVVRDGLYGLGPMAWLDEQVSDAIVSVHDTGISFDGTGQKPEFPKVDRDSVFTLQAEFLGNIFALVEPFIGAGFAVDLSAVDYYVFGEIEAPSFRTAATGEVFDLDPVTGEATWEVVRVPFMLSIPKETPAFKPPFPVVFYSHGSFTSRFESLLLSGTVARSGLAVAAIDSVGHGPIGADVENLMKEEGLSEEIGRVIFLTLAKILFLDGSEGKEDWPFDQMLDALFSIGVMQELTLVGRARDENGDGVIKNGEAFYVANPVRLRDNFRQSTLDFLQFVRVLRALDPDAVPAAMDGDATFTAEAAALEPYLLAGDFNADGVLDLGGPDAPFYMAGTSLGALMASAMASVEPEIEAATFLVPGGGLSDVFVSTTMHDAATPAFLYTFGPVLAGCRADGQFRVVFNDEAGNCKSDALARPEVVVTTFPAAGATSVGVRNVRSGEAAEGWLDAEIGFSVAVASDKGDLLELTVGYEDRAPITALVASRYDGLGVVRNTPDFRRNLQHFQMIFDPVDPGVLGQFLIRRPLDGRPKNILQFLVLGDRTMPVSSQLTLARSMGILGLDDETALPLNHALVAGGVPGGAAFDVDDLEQDDDDELGPLAPLQTDSGVSAVRFMNVDGWHEYMALPYPEDAPFDYSTWTHNVLRLYLESGGTRVEDDPCLEAYDCELP